MFTVNMLRFSSNPEKGTKITMPYITLSNGQKKAIQNESRRRRNAAEEVNLKSLAEWAKITFNLSRAPGSATISRILRAEFTLEHKDTAFRIVSPRNPAVDVALYN